MTRRGGGGEARRAGAALAPLLVRLELARPAVALLAALAAAAAFLARAQHGLTGLAPITAGVFLLVCGCGACNGWQDRRVDARMARTRQRPLPEGRISTGGALTFALAAAIAGEALILGGAGPAAAMWGAAAAVWYNGVYAALKRRSAFAQVPGALAGTAPALIGWIGGGGGLADPPVWALCLFLFVWQVPHFWLLLLERGAEYRSAGLPIPQARFGERGLARVAAVWVLSAAACGAALPLHHLISSGPGLAALGASSLLLVVFCVRKAGSRMRLVGINLYLTFVLFLIAAESLRRAATA